MRTIIAIITLIMMTDLAHAALPLRGGISNASCPAGSPSPDGSSIVPQPTGVASCILTDVLGNAYQYDTGTQLVANGVPYSNGVPEVQINSGGKGFISRYCEGALSPPALPAPQGLFWRQTTTGGFADIPWINPTTQQTATFLNNTQATSFKDLESLLSAAAAGNSLEIQAMPIGLAFYQFSGAPTVANLTITFDAGAKIGCTIQFGDSIITLSSGTPSGTTISGGEFAFAVDNGSGTFRGINFARASNPTLIGAYVHDNDMGVIQTGSNGLTTLTNDTFIHNGSGLSSAATHNIYMSCPNGTVATDCASDHYAITGVNSRCTSQGGFELKMRGPNGTTPIEGTFAEPDPNGFWTGAACSESAAIDMSCGGQYVLGNTTAGHGIVIEVGPQLQNTAGIVRFGQEAANTSNCPSGGTGWSINSLTIQNAWIINDFASVVNVVAIGAAVASPSCVVKNSKIVGSGSVIGLGSGCTDGGGNTFFATRTAAGLGAFPAIPSPP